MGSPVLSPAMTAIDRASREKSSRYRLVALAVGCVAGRGAPLPVRRRPWKRAVLAPTAAAPRMKRHLGCLRPGDLLFVMYLTSPAQEGALQWQARKPRCSR